MSPSHEAEKYNDIKKDNVKADNLCKVRCESRLATCSTICKQELDRHLKRVYNSLPFFDNQAHFPQKKPEKRPEGVWVTFKQTVSRKDFLRLPSSLRITICL